MCLSSGDKKPTPKDKFPQPSEIQDELYILGPGFYNPSLVWVVDI